MSKIERYHGRFLFSRSWVFSPEAEKGSAILGDIISREIAFSHNEKTVNLFFVNKKKINVYRYAMSHHPTILFEDGLELQMSETFEIFKQYKGLYTRLSKKS